jgi:hypothetical protein
VVAGTWWNSSRRDHRLSGLPRVVFPPRLCRRAGQRAIGYGIEPANHIGTTQHSRQSRIPRVARCRSYQTVAIGAARQSVDTCFQKEEHRVASQGSFPAKQSFGSVHLLWRACRYLITHGQACRGSAGEIHREYSGRRRQLVCDCLGITNYPAEPSCVGVKSSRLVEYCK